ncbi:MAG: alanyl-tRNA editing protein [Bryobacteraceae bacterium]
MTERLYYNDCYLKEFDARVVDSDASGTRVYLDRTAFYPTSGGQLFDLGTLGGVAVTEVVDEDDRIAHVLAGPLKGSEVAGEIDWVRRFDFMQQHTGQHLLSAVLEELFGWKTVSVHMGTDNCTVDVDAVAVSEVQLEKAEVRCAEIIAQARPTAISFEDGAVGLRKESAREGTLRVVSIEGVDRSACGGTHVRSSAEIGLVLTGKTEKIRSSIRIEFCCGGRALKRARGDNQLLGAISRALLVPASQGAERIGALMESNKVLDKERQRLVAELAKREGRELYLATEVGADGVRRVTVRGVIDDAVRARAQAFVVGERAVFLAVSEETCAILLAASGDSGVNAGERVKRALGEVGGRGGGNAALAQGSVPDARALERVVEMLGS